MNSMVLTKELVLTLGEVISEPSRRFWKGFTYKTFNGTAKTSLIPVSQKSIDQLVDESRFVGKSLCRVSSFEQLAPTLKVLAPEIRTAKRAIMQLVARDLDEFRQMQTEQIRSLFDILPQGCPVEWALGTQPSERYCFIVQAVFGYDEQPDKYEFPT